MWPYHVLNGHKTMASLSGKGHVKKTGFVSNITAFVLKKYFDLRYDKIIWNFIVFLQSYDLNLTVLVIKSTGFYNWNVTNNEVLSKMKSNPKLNVIKTKMLSKLACHQDWNVLNMIGFVLIKTEFFSNVTAFVLKLDGVGPVDNRPSTKNLHHSVKKKMWHVTHDTWLVTCDMWHVTSEIWHLTCFGGEHSL